MRIEHFDTEWGNPGSYSQAVRFGDILFTCGQLGAEPGGPAVDFETQARTALQRLVSVVSASGGGADTIIRINGYLASMEDFPVYDRIYQEVIGVEPKPARTTVQIGGFVAPLRVEVDAVAVARESLGDEPS
jgi:2-iminobutanoate/2-iminopropanoate deaminase